MFLTIDVKRGNPLLKNHLYMKVVAITNTVYKMAYSLAVQSHG